MTDAFKQQHKVAAAMVGSLTRQGGDPIGQSQALALATGKLAASARNTMAPEKYQFFVKELAQAVIDEAGLSTSQSPH